MNVKAPQSEDQFFPTNLTQLSQSTQVKKETEECKSVFENTEKLHRHNWNDDPILSNM